MLLVVDVGNTQTHFGAFDGDQLIEHWRFATVRTSTADELGAVLRNLMELRGLGLADLDGSIVSSTVPQLRPEWRAVGSRYLRHETIIVGPGIKTGMALRYDNPREIGPDRLVNAVASFEAIGGAASASTSAPRSPSTGVRRRRVPRRDHLPGRRDLDGALSTRAAALPKIELHEPRSLIGKSTIDAIRSGIVFGFAGMVDSVVGRLRDELGHDTATIATGGLAASIVPFTESIDQLDEMLTLTGLRLLWERNR